MKFHLENKWTPGYGDQTIKSYMCTSCFYKRVISESSGTVRVIEGDAEFTLFPFISFTKITGEHVELCACPKCQTVQMVERVENAEEISHIVN